jgi:hypothetical protein
VSVCLHLDPNQRSQPEGKILIRSSGKSYAESRDGIEVVVVDS